MSLLAAIIVLVLLRQRTDLRVIHRDGWFYRWYGFVRGLLPAGMLATLLACLVPSLLVYAGLESIQHALLGLPYLAAMVVLLLYSVGRGQYAERVER